MRIPWLVALVAVGAGAGAAAFAATSETTEVEPNDTLASAQAIVVGDTLHGVLDPGPGEFGQAGDRDVFALELVAGTIIDLDLLARRAGSSLEASMQLLAPGGTLLYESYRDIGWDPTLRGIRITQSGRHYVRLTAIGGAGAHATYTLGTGPTRLGPGDPTSTRVGVPPEQPFLTQSIAAGPRGEVHILTPAANGPNKFIWQIEPDGTSRLLATTDGNAFDFDLDSFGDLLLPEPEHQRVLRVSTRTGTRTVMHQFESLIPFALTVAPGGDVWVAASPPVSDAFVFVRLDRWGRELDRIVVDLLPATVAALAISPSGVPHFVDNYIGVYRVDAAGAELVYEDPEATSLAFDEAGHLYLSHTGIGLVRLGAEYQVIDEPFAVSDLNAASDAAFLRDATGVLTNRLAAPTRGLIVEVDATAIPAPGAGPAIDPVTLEHAAEGLLTGVGLPASTAAGLDYRGNDNGMFDVGDLAALAAAY